MSFLSKLFSFFKRTPKKETVFRDPVLEHEHTLKRLDQILAEFKNDENFEYVAGVTLLTIRRKYKDLYHPYAITIFFDREFTIMQGEKVILKPKDLFTNPDTEYETLEVLRKHLSYVCELEVIEAIEQLDCVSHSLYDNEGYLFHLTTGSVFKITNDMKFVYKDQQMVKAINGPITETMLKELCGFIEKNKDSFKTILMKYVEEREGWEYIESEGFESDMIRTNLTRPDMEDTEAYFKVDHKKQTVEYDNRDGYCFQPNTGMFIADRGAAALRTIGEIHTQLLLRQYIKRKLKELPDVKWVLVIGKAFGFKLIPTDVYHLYAKFWLPYGKVNKDTIYVVLSKENDFNWGDGYVIDDESVEALTGNTTHLLRSLRTSQMQEDGGVFIKSIGEYGGYPTDKNELYDALLKRYSSLYRLHHGVNLNLGTERQDWVLNLLSYYFCIKTPSIWQNQSFDHVETIETSSTDREVLNYLLFLKDAQNVKGGDLEALRKFYLDELTKVSKPLSTEQVVRISKLFSDKDQNVVVMTDQGMAVVKEDGTTVAIKPKRQLTPTPASRLTLGKQPVVELPTKFVESSKYVLYKGTQAFVDKDKHQALFEFWMNKSYRDAGDKAVYLELIDPREEDEKLFKIIVDERTIYLVPVDSLPKLNNPRKQTSKPKRGKRK